ncbi:MAG: dehydrogenase [Bdellovibrionaceae bacterium]|nr:dehydrogenase [Pseudobdellovibrionaceae bacterium]
MKNSYRIAEISFGRSDWDAMYSFELQGRRFDVQRFGVNFSIDTLKSLILSLRNDVDAFAVVSLPPPIHMDGQSFVHPQYLEVMQIPCSVPLCDGAGLREVACINSLVNHIESGRINPDRGVFFPAAILSIEMEEFLRTRYGAKVYFGDAYSMFGIPLMLQPFPGLMTLAKGGLSVATLKDLRRNTPVAHSTLQKISRSALATQVEDVQYVAGDLPFILLFDRATEFIRGKDLIIWSHHVAQEKDVEKFGPRSLINLFPEEFKVSPYMNFSVLDASLRLVHGKKASLSIPEWEEILRSRLDLREPVRRLSSGRRPSLQFAASKAVSSLRSALLSEKKPDFAFVVHALSHRDFERVPGVGKVIKMLPLSLHDTFDEAVAKAPPFVYGKVRHVISRQTGKEINGIIYALWATPKVLMNTPPEITYRQIEKICYDAAARGAKIIGLGAYTKVIGDAGVTINQNSPIPVTTGNSLSASATLWGLYEVMSKIDLLPRDQEGRFTEGMAMVIGATGSIGSVSAKLLALAFPKLVLVAPRINRLLELKAEIEKINPNCQVICTTDANELAGEADALVTATSAFDQKIVDIEKLKPGCVVCDCSRPLDFDKEDAKKRPDVLIVESGEVVLPGPYEVTCDLGLPGNTVYACLGETALLALEERFEPFTLGRDIDWNKVKEIYNMARRHGVQLSAIQGHMGLITDREIALTRELALSRHRELTHR